MQTNDQNPTPNAYSSVPPQHSGGLFKHPHHFLHIEHTPDPGMEQPQTPLHDVTMFPTQKMTGIVNYPQTPQFYEELDSHLIPDLDTQRLSAVELMQISGIIQAVRLPQPQPHEANATLSQQDWESNFKQLTGSLRAINAHEHQLSGGLQQVKNATDAAQPLTTKPPAWKAFINHPVVRTVFGILIGVGMLYLVAHFVDIPTTMEVLRTNLTTPQGIINALLSCFFFIFAFSIRGARWKLFLRPLTNVNVLKVIQIYWVSVFINVLLPVQGGEFAKSLMLKRISGVPVSQSLPTVAMDRSLDLMPALIIMAIVPFIPGIHMNAVLWGVLGLVGGILLGLIFIVALTAWNRKAAIAFIHFMCRLLPAKIGNKIEGFAMGFVDSLLAGASNPKNFIPAVLITCVAVCSDGLFAMFSFWTVGLSSINFGASIFGYTVFNIFTILPTPPGHVGSNELIGTLVFGDLLGFDKKGVLAMFVFSHPLTALIMALMALVSLSALGLKLSSAFKGLPNEEKQHSAQKDLPAREAAIV